MTVHVRHLIPPVDPVARAALVEHNRRNGWRPVPGISDHELGWIVDADQPTAPLRVPPGPVIRPSRPSGWTPFVLALTAVVLVAAIAGLVAR